MNTKHSFPKNYFKSGVNTKVQSKEECLVNTPAFRRTFVEFIEALPKDAVVLDAGCGGGKFSRKIISLRPDIKIYAIDISDVEDVLPKQITFVQGSVEDLRDYYEEGFFDAVVCFHVLEHLLYPMLAMSSFKSVLKNGGKIYLETPNWSRGLVPFLDTYFWNDYTHIRIFTKKTIRNLFEDYDYKIRTLISVSSMTLFTRNDSVKKISNLYKKEKDNKGSVFSFFKSFITKSLARIISAFLKDVIVIIADSVKK